MDKTIAVLTVNDANKLKAKDLRLLAEWLEKQSEFLREMALYGNNISSRFRARYITHD